MAPHSSTLAWKIPWTEEPSRLQSMGSQKSDMTEQLYFTSLHFTSGSYCLHRQLWSWKYRQSLSTASKASIHYFLKFLQDLPRWVKIGHNLLFVHTVCPYCTMFQILLQLSLFLNLSLGIWNVSFLRSASCLNHLYFLIIISIIANATWEFEWLFILVCTNRLESIH